MCVSFLWGIILLHKLRDRMPSYVAMYLLYYTALMWLHKSHHRIHVASLKHSLGNPLQLAAQQTVAQLRGHPTALEQAENKLPSLDEGRRWDAACLVLSLISKVSYLAEGAIQNKNPIQYPCCPSSNVLFEKLISHGICTPVSLSLTVHRNWVKGPEAPLHQWKKDAAPKNEAQPSTQIHLKK